MTLCQCHHYCSPINTYQDVVDRCNATTTELRRTLEKIHTLQDGWATLFRCRECGSLWCEEYPFSEYHGGGPPCVYRVETQDAVQWTQNYQPLTSPLRQQHEDLVFLRTLGDEIGPELCRSTGCGRLRIRFSAMCRQHH